MKAFNYNSIIALNTSSSVLKFLHKYANDDIYENEKLLSVIYDHRHFKLDEKNLIKWFIERLLEVYLETHFCRINLSS